MSEDGQKPRGPLDELFPTLRSEREPVPFMPVHARVLETREGDAYALTIVTWSDPGSPRALHEALRQRIEGALLAELCRPAAELREEAREYVRVRWLAFSDLGFDPSAAVSAFALRRVPYDAPALRETMALVRGEAQRVSAPTPEAPVAVWEVDVRSPAGERGEKLAWLEAQLREQNGDEVWGEKPGAFFMRLSALLPAIGEAPFPPDASALASLEALVGQRTTEHVRFVSPMLFQSLCDAVGVVASRDFGRSVQWAPSEPDDDGFAPPPLLRAKLPDGLVHVPIGVHLLRWCVMPLMAGENPATLSDWARDQFGRPA